MKRRIHDPPVYMYINFDPKWIKKGLAPQKTPQNDEYVFFQLKNKIFFLKQGFFRN
jgi:hypothetical protein